MNQATPHVAHTGHCCGPAPASAFVERLQVILTAACLVSLVVAVAAYPPAAYAAVVFGSFFAIRSAQASIRAREVDVNLLMVIAAIGAVILRHAVDAAILLFLFSLSNTLESFAAVKTRSAIEALVKLRPQTARRKDGEMVPVEDIHTGDHIQIAPFETVPMDGRVIEGLSSVDQSAMTGESIPVAKATGDLVLAGTQNMHGGLVVEVATEVGNSALDHVIALVEEAHAKKSSTQQFSAWFGQRYTFLVTGAALAFFLIQLGLHIPADRAFYSALTLLVAMSPCALVISTPSTTLSALAWAARHGILIRGGKFIELAGKVDTIAFDKTGTLTMGAPELVDCQVWSSSNELIGVGMESHEARGFIRSVAAAELLAGHPIGDAIVKAVEAWGEPLSQALDHHVEPGLGVRAKVNGRDVLVGIESFVVASGQIPEGLTAFVVESRSEGRTVALASADGQIGALCLMDTPRACASEVVNDVKHMGIKQTLLLSGDTPATATAIGRETGIDEAIGGLLPEGKSDQIAKMTEAGATVMMVGDGVNDAPSLAHATIGVAMGGLGSDVALNNADIVLMRDDLTAIPELIRLGRKCNRTLIANLVFAGAVICVLTTTSLLGHLTLPFAVVGHEGSTVVVILNGLRMLSGPGRR